MDAFFVHSYNDIDKLDACLRRFLLGKAAIDKKLMARQSRWYHSAVYALRNNTDDKETENTPLIICISRVLLNTALRILLEDSVVLLAP